MRGTKAESKVWTRETVLETVSCRRQTGQPGEMCVRRRAGHDVMLG